MEGIDRFFVLGIEQTPAELHIDTSMYAYVVKAVPTRRFSEHTIG
jgi:hypothetical protein